MRSIASREGRDLQPWVTIIWHERMGLRADRRVAGSGADALLLDQKALCGRGSRVRDYGKGVHHAEGADDALLRADGQRDEPEHGGLPAVRLGQDFARSAFGMRA